MLVFPLWKPEPQGGGAKLPPVWDSRSPRTWVLLCIHWTDWWFHPEVSLPRAPLVTVSELSTMWLVEGGVDWQQVLGLGRTGLNVLSWGCASCLTFLSWASVSSSEGPSVNTVWTFWSRNAKTKASQLRNLSRGCQSHCQPPGNMTFPLWVCFSVLSFLLSAHCFWSPIFLVWIFPWVLANEIRFWKDDEEFCLEQGLWWQTSQPLSPGSLPWTPGDSLLCSAFEDTPFRERTCPCGSAGKESSCQCKSQRRQVQSPDQEDPPE